MSHKSHIKNSLLSTKKLTISRKTVFSKRGLLVTGLLFGLVGVTLQLRSMAAVNYGVIEAESATRTGNVSIVSNSLASGGSAVEFSLPVVVPPVPTTPTTPTVPTPTTPLPTTTTDKLAFDMPTTAVLRASKKKVFAHYMTAWPLSDRFDCYNTPQCDNNRYAAFGGYLRDKPLQKSTGTSSAAAQKADMKLEINQAIAAGLDGFIVNISSYTTDDHWRILLDTLAAVNESNSGFKIILMPDMVTMNKHSATELADIIAKVAKDPALYRLADGSVVISPFNSDLKDISNAANPLTYWPEFISTLNSKHGVKVAFVPTWVSVNMLYQNWQSFSYGFSSFGMHSPLPSYLSANKAVADQSHSLGKVWMQPVSFQDYRAKSGSYYEAGNTELLRTSWQAAINGADWVQFVTWNDYGENSNMAPSNSSCWNILDLSAYYLAKFKTGVDPVIKRDTLYLTHRRQPVAARGSGPMTANSGLRSGGAGVTIQPRDEIEVVSFLTSPSRIDIKANGTTIKSCDVSTGVAVCKTPLVNGTISAVAVRNSATVSTVQTPFPVTPNLYIQNLRYDIAGSRR